MNKAILFGLGTLTKLVLYNNSIQENPLDIIALTAEEEYVNTDSINGIPVMSYEKVREVYPPDSGVRFLVCVGYTNMNQERKRISERIHDDGYGFLNFIDKQAILRTDSIGTGNIFLEGCNIGPGCTIGSGNIFYPNALLAHDSIVGDFNYFAISSSIGGFSQVADCCFIGNNASVRDNCCLSSYTLIGAGAYLDRNTLAYAVVVPERSHILEKKNSLQMNL